MPTNTTRLSLTKPTGPENYSVGIVNANSDKLDETAGAIHCTSGARPTTNLFDGRLAYETDTRALISYTVSGGVWRYLTPAYVGSKAAQDALTPKHDGMACWRTDRDFMAYWTGSTWYVPGSPIFPGTTERNADLTSPVAGQKAITSSNGLEWIYYSGAWTYSPRRIGGEFRANANKSIFTGSQKIQYQTTLRNEGLTVINNDGFQVPADGLYAMSVFNKFGFGPGLPTSVSASIGGVNFATPMYSGDEFVDGTDIFKSCVRWVNVNDIICSYIYLNDATTRLLDVSARPSEFSIWRVG